MTFDISGGIMSKIGPVTFATGTYNFSSSTTVSDAIGVWIQSPPIAGTNAVFTRTWGLYVQGGDIYHGGPKLQIAGTSATYAAATFGTTGVGISTANATYTSDAGYSGTVTAHSLGTPTLAATTATQTITTAATLYIAAAPVAGANTTITTSFALYVAAGESFLGSNLKIGATTARATTAGTNQLVLFDGTAPVGTLTNGVSLYSASGDLNFMDSTGAAYKVGFRNVPVNSQSAAYTAVLTDSGKFIFHPSSDLNARTFTIPAVGSVNYDVGTVLTFVNMTSQVVTIAITTDTMYLAGTGATGSRSLAQYGVATAIKMTTGVGTTTWLISGTGLT
jgi:hypothetical protein